MNGSRFARLLKRSRREYALIGVTVLLLVPVLMAALAPLLAPIPTQASGWVAPPLPQRNEPLPDFQHLLDPLPLIVRDLPDDASQNVAAIYDTVTLSNRQSLEALVDAAAQAIPVPSTLQAEWNAWIRTVNESSQDDSPVPYAVLSALQGDANNGDRLSNFAVALYLRAIEPESIGSQPLALLRATVQVFPGSRGAVLNYMALGANPYLSDNPDGTVVFEEWLESHPDDVTAIQLSVFLYTQGRTWSYDPDPAFLARFARDLAASPDPPRAALGHALLGDIAFRQAESHQEFAPYDARQLALGALQEYDLALGFSDDSSLYSARSMALAFLGNTESAIATQQRGVDIQPESITPRIHLASLYLNKRGSETEIHDAAVTARNLSREALDASRNQGEPPLADVQVLTAGRGVSAIGVDQSQYAAARPARSYFVSYPFCGMAGGGYAISFDLIPVVVDPSFGGIANIPAIRAAYLANNSSVILGDPQGAHDDLERMRQIFDDSLWVWDMPQCVIHPAFLESSMAEASLVADSSEAEDVSGAFGVLGLLRSAGLNEQAIEICRTANERGEDFHESARSRLELCIAENAYLAGDYETSQQAFESLGNDLMVGYVAQRRENLDEAIRRYRLVVESSSEYGYVAMLRLADALLDSGDPERALAYYDELISWLDTDEYGIVNQASLPVEVMRPLAYSNRGEARLMMLVDRDGNIRCDGDAWGACTAAFRDFSTALETDAHNPLFLMNQAWVARLLDDEALSAQLMSQALDVDVTLFPVQNDLGVFAAEVGDTTAARQYFLDAVAANPQYDLALWNLGVLHMQDGIGGILRGQGYLARAVLLNRSLVTEALDFRTDERFYRVEINEQVRPGAGWTFGTSSSVATATFGFITFLLMCLQAFRLVGIGTLQDTVTNWVSTGLNRIQPPGFRKPPFVMNDQWSRWLPLAVAITVLVFTTTQLASRSEPQAVSASVALALIAVVLAVVVHEFGHSLAAKHFRTTLESAQWAPGTMLSLLLLPVNLSSGPFPGQRVVADNDATSKWVYIAGPLANLAVAIGAYFLFSLQPLPWLRQISQVQLAAMGYALLPFAPLDGAALASSHPRLLGVMGGVSLLLGVLFSLGIL